MRLASSEEEVISEGGERGSDLQDPGLGVAPDRGGRRDDGRGGGEAVGAPADEEQHGGGEGGLLDHPLLAEVGQAQQWVRADLFAQGLEDIVDRFIKAAPGAR